MLARTSLALVTALGACSSSPDSKPQDAASGQQPPGEAAVDSVRTVACPPGMMPTVTTMGNGGSATYTPTQTTISVQGIVQFIMPPEHDVVPTTSLANDPGLKVDYGQTACLLFTKAGTFNFHCQTHLFAGSIVVH